VEARSIEKIFQIDDNIGAATSGLVADARVLVDRARVECQVHRITYGEPMDVELLAKKICDFKQLYTQHGGVRPFGIALLIAGVNETPRLFETDPSGALIEYKATAIGAGRTTAMEIFEKEYRDDLTKDEAIDLALKIMNEVTDGKMSESSIDMAVVELETQEFRKFTPQEVRSYLERVPRKSDKEEEEE